MQPPHRFRPVQCLLDRRVEGGRFPGYAAAVRHAGRTELIVGGRRHLDRDDPMTPDTQFRLASVSKPFAGVLTLQLVEDGVLDLDDPVAAWLPEFADPRVLRDIDADLDETVPAERPITVRNLLTNTAGFGGIWRPCPLADAMTKTGGEPGLFPPTVGHDEFVRRLAALPLAAQPGERWLYHVTTDVLSVRLAGLYEPTDSGFRLLDAPGGRFARPPAFEGLGAGLVSTAPDVLALFSALADGGAPLLRPGSDEALISDQLTDEQRDRSEAELGAGTTWGFQVGIHLEGRPMSRGSWGWDGGTGTSAWADPARDVVGVLLTQRLMSGPDDAADWFWQAVYDCL